MELELRNTARYMRDNEATDSRIYRNMAMWTKSAHNRQVLLTMAQDEGNHRRVWAEYLEEEPATHKLKVFLFSALSKVFGLTFVIKLMESGEHKAITEYGRIGGDLPIAAEILEDEVRHENELVSMIEEDGLSYISSMVLGLSDALVELTGALAGFTLALNDNTMIGLAGFITGVAATLSMACSEYLAEKSNPGQKHPLKAASYTGLAYLFTVTVLLLPYALTSEPLTALAFCLLNATLVIIGFTYFVSIVRSTSFLKGLREMLLISFGVALIAFFIGLAARTWLNLDL